MIAELHFYQAIYADTAARITLGAVIRIVRVSNPKTISNVNLNVPVRTVLDRELSSLPYCI